MMAKMDLATGGDPLASFTKAMLWLAREHRGLLPVQVAHDDGCPCTVAPFPGMDACSCEIVELTYPVRG